MNSYLYPVIEEMFNPVTGETTRMWFCSNRLVSLIIRKVNNKSWHRQYISLEESPWHTYRPRLVAVNGMIVLSKK